MDENQDNDKSKQDNASAESTNDTKKVNPSKVLEQHANIFARYVHATFLRVCQNHLYFRKHYMAKNFMIDLPGITQSTAKKMVNALDQRNFSEWHIKTAAYETVAYADSDITQGQNNIPKDLDMSSAIKSSVDKSDGLTGMFGRTNAIRDKKGYLLTARTIINNNQEEPELEDVTGTGDKLGLPSDYDPTDIYFVHYTGKWHGQGLTNDDFDRMKARTPQHIQIDDVNRHIVRHNETVGKYWLSFIVSVIAMSLPYGFYSFFLDVNYLPGAMVYAVVMYAHYLAMNVWNETIVFRLIICAIAWTPEFRQYRREKKHPNIDYTNDNLQ